MKRLSLLLPFFFLPLSSFSSHPVLPIGNKPSIHSIAKNTSPSVDHCIVKTRPSAFSHDPTTARAQLHQLTQQVLSGEEVPPPDRLIQNTDVRIMQSGLNRIYRFETHRPKNCKKIQETFPLEIEYSHLDFEAIPTQKGGNTGRQVVLAPSSPTMNPTDPYWKSSGAWGQSYPDLWYLKKIQASSAWPLDQGQGQVIAVVDTGIYFDHPDLQGNQWENIAEKNGSPGVDDDGNGFIDDVLGWDFHHNDATTSDHSGHGTHVSGLISAIGNNGIGGIGIAPQARLMAVKGFSDGGGSGYSSNLAAGIVYAALEGAHVINNSWSCSFPCPSNPVVEDAVRFALEQGAISVFSAGNIVADVSAFSPQNMEETITVGSSTENDERSFFSNFGPLVDITAPGGGNDSSAPDYLGANMLSTCPPDSDLCSTFPITEGYARSWGTSQSAPLISGLVAMIRKQFPSDSLGQVRGRLMNSAEPISKGRTWLGSDRVNAWKALTVIEKPQIRLLDSQIVETQGDGDQVPEPGEQIELRVELKNDWKDALSVSATLQVEGSDGHVSISQASAQFGSLAHGETTNNHSNPFLLNVLSVDNPFDTPVDAKLVVNADGHLQEFDLLIPLGMRAVGTSNIPLSASDLDGKTLVWSDWVFDCYLADLETGEITFIADNCQTPRVSWPRVVWEDTADPYAPRIIVRDYTFQQPKTTILSHGPTSKTLPDISGTKVVWSEMVGIFWDVFYADVTRPNDVVNLSNFPTSNQIWARIDGNFVVWEDQRHLFFPDIFDIDYYLYDLRNGQQTRITSTEQRFSHDLHDQKIVFNGSPEIEVFEIKWNIHLIDLSNPSFPEYIVRSVSGTDSRTPRIHQNQIVFQEENAEGFTNILRADIVDLSGPGTFDITPITIDASNQVSPLTSRWNTQNRILWWDFRKSTDFFVTSEH